MHVEGRSWTFNLEDELKTRFTGVSIELMPTVLIRVVFADGDTYTWHKVCMIVGHHGSQPCQVLCQQTAVLDA